MQASRVSGQFDNRFGSGTVPERSTHAPGAKTEKAGKSSSPGKYEF
jgi:hypothetical protein